MAGGAPVGVGADYAYFASQLGQNPMEMYGLYTAPLSGYTNQQLGPNMDAGSQQSNTQPRPQPQTQSQQEAVVAVPQTTDMPVRQNADLSVMLNSGHEQGGQYHNGGIILQHAPPQETTMFPMGPNPRTEPPTPQPPGPPETEQQVMTNLFIAGIDKGVDFKQFFHPDTTSGGPDKPRGVHHIPGISAPAKDTLNAAAATGGSQRRAMCDPLVDAVFALDDITTLWMARDAIRNYITRLRPQGKARFGVVLCGEQHSFYTSLHQHFSGLLASLEDLQHANVTLDITEHMPDTPGTRSDNNPYPPSVSEDFAQTTAGCLETAYFMFMYQVS
nr:hypothetical protein BaRGS_014788 [Batillaria attramentaria]